MEQLYPQMCWKYQDSQHLWTRLSSQNNEIDSYSDFEARITHVVSPVEFYVQPCILMTKADNLIASMDEYYKVEREPVPADRVS